MIRVALVAVLAACSVYEDHVRITPLFVADGEKLDCEKQCADPDIDSVNFCTVATSAVRPYLACKVQVHSYSFEVGIEPPRGFDLSQQGDVALEHCPLGACAKPVRDRMGYSSAEPMTVTGCRVARRSVATATQKFLVCSVRTKTDAAASLQ